MLMQTPCSLSSRSVVEHKIRRSHTRLVTYFSYYRDLLFSILDRKMYYYRPKPL